MTDTRRSEPATFLVDTPRLLLRPPLMSDAPELATIFGDPTVMATTRAGHTLDLADTELLLADAIDQFRIDRFGPCTVVRLATGEIIGRSGVTVWDSVRWIRRPVWEPGLDLDVGGVFRRSVWGRGLGTEALRASRDWVFAHTGAARVLALVRPDNPAIVRITGKLGMTAIDHVRVSGVEQDVYAIDRERWESVTRTPGHIE